MSANLTRRGFLKGVGGACAASLCAASGAGEEPALPRVDLHVHLDNSTIDAVAKLSAERGVPFGVVEHAGTKENVYPVVLSNDAELTEYLDRLEGKAAYKGVQAEWTDWRGCFSREALAGLDYVLTDAMTFPGPDGRRMKLWEEGADIGDVATFMDRYVDWYVEILTTQPIDILANVSWLPPALGRDYDSQWTEARILRVVEAAVKQGVAIELSSGFRLPGLRFLRVAKEAGVRFTFGSNGRYPNMGLLDYSVETARALGLKAGDMFTPTKGGCRAAREA